MTLHQKTLQPPQSSPLTVYLPPLDILPKHGASNDWGRVPSQLQSGLIPPDGQDQMSQQSRPREVPLQVLLSEKIRTQKHVGS